MIDRSFYNFRLKLGEAEVESMAGVPVISHEELMTKLRKKISVY